MTRIGVAALASVLVLVGGGPRESEAAEQRTVKAVSSRVHATGLNIAWRF